MELGLGVRVTGLDRAKRQLLLDDGSHQPYDKLVLATGARPFLPPIPGLDQVPCVFPLRTATDIEGIRQAVQKQEDCRAVIIGGGYIGLETAASLRKLGVEVTLLEKEERLLSRVTSPFMSTYFYELHRGHGVAVHTARQVSVVEPHETSVRVRCTDGTTYPADLLLVGAGIVVNTELAAESGLEINNGIRVDATARTSDEHIYAIGDCTSHFNPHFGRNIRLESVQNAVDQAKVAAAALCGKQPAYDSLPWFWSDQYDVKLQMVGLSTGYDKTVIRTEGPDSFSVWYLNEEKVLAVDAVNSPKAYVVGTRLIKDRSVVDTAKLSDVSIPLKPEQVRV
ncbi:NAD(P)/FAD-dependent oxidoreductase [Dyadobacter jiangsuensis]